MNVELAEERILLIPDRFSLEEAEGRAWAKRTDAFGAFAKLGGLLSKPKDEEFEIVYRERRLQPFWRISAYTDHTYERSREHRIKVGPEVKSATLYGQTLTPVNREITVTLTDNCREETRREWLFDGLSKTAQPNLKTYVALDARHVPPDELNAQATADGPCPTIIVPPQAKSSSLTREVLTQAMPKIEADRILEEKIQLDAIDLYYRPVYAFRYKWQGKEAVVECDAATGETRAGGTTFEAYVGKFIDPDFLLDAGVEAANMILPGVNLARIVLVKGLKLGQKS